MGQTWLTSKLASKMSLKSTDRFNSHGSANKLSSLSSYNTQTCPCIWFTVFRVDNDIMTFIIVLSDVQKFKHPFKSLTYTIKISWVLASSSESMNKFFLQVLLYQKKKTPALTHSCHIIVLTLNSHWAENNLLDVLTCVQMYDHSPSIFTPSLLQRLFCIISIACSCFWRNSITIQLPQGKNENEHALKW